MEFLCSDMLDTVLCAKRQPLGYTPFGSASHFSQANLAFHGQLMEARSQLYLLGNGYRLYMPTLMRFAQYDYFSPFEKGGFNAYAFCGADPINRKDPDGAAGLFAGAIKAQLPAKVGRKTYYNIIHANRAFQKKFKKAYQARQTHLKLVANPHAHSLAVQKYYQRLAKLESLSDGLRIDPDYIRKKAKYDKYQRFDMDYNFSNMVARLEQRPWAQELARAADPIRSNFGASAQLIMDSPSGFGGNRPLYNPSYDYGTSPAGRLPPPPYEQAHLDPPYDPDALARTRR